MNYELSNHELIALKNNMPSNKKTSLIFDLFKNKRGDVLKCLVFDQFMVQLYLSKLLEDRL